MAKLTRKYTTTTIKKLFGFSGNQCAHPECLNPIIENETELSDAAVVGQICHIYAISEDGPRGKIGLTEKELNSLGNLILCCGHHHPVIDKQHETYPAERLKQWKSVHEAKIARLVSQGSKPIHSELFDHRVYPKDLVDKKLDESIELLRKSRFFSSYDRVGNAERLAKDVIGGMLSGASDAKRCKALSWCARILSVTDKEDNAKALLDAAKVLDVCNQIGIAEAFIASRSKGKSASIKIVSEMDCPEARSASLMIVAAEDGIEKAERWLQEAGLEVDDLDADGKFFLLSNLLQSSKWESANSCLEKISDFDCKNSPLLFRTIALTHLINAIAIELRHLVVGQIPFDARRFPLSSTPGGLESLHQARRYFSLAASAERALGFSDAASFCEDYILWLELRDQELYDQAVRKLEVALSDPTKGLRLVALGLEFGVKINKETVEKEINRQTALRGDITFDAAIARFALCFAADSEAEVAQALENYKSILVKHIDIVHILRIQTEMYARSSQLERAKDCLSELQGRGLDDEELRRIKRFVDSAEGGDKIEILIQEYNQTSHINDLDILTEELAELGRYHEMVGYAKQFFEKTLSLKAASRYVTALFNSHDYTSVVSYIEENEFLLEQSDYLRLLLSWALYNEGRLMEAKAELGKINKDYKEAEARILTINLAISLGDWNSIAVTLAHEYEKIEERTDEELIQLAKLASQVGSPYLKNFLFKAAKKGTDNPQVQTSAYLIATEAGIENNENTALWLKRAIELSGDNGPMRMTTLQEVMDLKPGWDSRSNDLWGKVARTEAPLFVAGEVLNKTLIQSMLFPAISNLVSRDVRQRVLIPAYSGKRPVEDISGISVIGLDATALLTLSFLEITEKVLDNFEKIYIPHSTLGWLFSEKEKASFHQPSKIKDAHQIRHLISEGDLSILEPLLPPNSDLAAIVGEELAQLLTEARNISVESKHPVFVVRSSPVRQISSYTDSLADLSDYADLLSGCQYLIHRLFELGQISESDEKSMSEYLFRNEEPWPAQPEVPIGSTLMLDGLAVTYLQHLGVLDKLKQSGFKVFISKKEVAEANGLISFEKSSAKVRDAIEELRSLLNRGICEGKIVIGRRIISDKDDENKYSNHPSYGAILLADNCDAVIFDDRYFNKNSNIQGKKNAVKTFTSLDLLYGLKEKGIISSKELNSYKTTLRKAGYFFVALEEEELLSYVLSSSVKGRKLIETLELKSVRESIIRVRMSNWLSLPDEASWMAGHFKLFSSVLKRLWQVCLEQDLEATKIKANWLLEFLDIRGWAHSLSGEQMEQLGNTGRLNHVMLIVAFPPELQEDIKEEYLAWLDKKIVLPIKEEYPELYTLLLESQKAYIDHVVNSNFPGDQKSTQSLYMKGALFEAAMGSLSPTISNSLCLDDEFKNKYHVTQAAQLSIGDTGISIDRFVFLSCIREILSGKNEVECNDSEERSLYFVRNSENQGYIQLILGKEGRKIALPEFFQYSPRKNDRVARFQHLADEVNLPIEDKCKWESILEQRPLHDEEFEKYNAEFENAPSRVFETIKNHVRSGKSTVEDLVPHSARYYERLIGRYDGSLTIHEFIEEVLKPHIALLYGWRKREGFSQALLLSAHPAISPLLAFLDLDSSCLIEELNKLETQGDTTSCIGAIEIGFKLLPIYPQIEKSIIGLISKLQNENIDEDATGISLFAALVVLVDGELSRIKLFRNAPPFYRRLASFSHAAAIHRQAISLQMKGDGFIDWAYEQRGHQYFVQACADMRQEQRWTPDYLNPTQIKADLLGRVLIAASAVREGIEGSQVYKMVLGDEEGTILSNCHFPASYMPGPLEVGDPPVLDIPENLKKAIKENLGSEELSPPKLNALLNASLVFKVDIAYAEEVARIIKDSRYHINCVESKDQLFSVLVGLARLSAVTRCSILADALRIILRVYRHDEHYKLTVDNIFRISLEAAASRADVQAWCEYVGSIFNDMAFGELSNSEAGSIEYYLSLVSDTVPELWKYCSRADAALNSLRSS